MAQVITLTRRGVVNRLACAYRRWKLRRLIKAGEHQIQYLQASLEANRQDVRDLREQLRIEESA